MSKGAPKLIERAHVPNEITEAEDQDSNTGELNCIGKSAMECLNVVSKHGR